MDIKTDMALLKQWEGKQEIFEEDLAPFPVRALKSTIEAPYVGSGASGEPLPPLWHWLYFLPVPAQSALGEDGHARRGGFLPPVPLPRRMWAGGRFAFSEALRVGDHVRKTSTIKSVDAKEGRSGALVFVTVRHELDVDGRQRLWEEHDIVYRDLPAPGTQSPASQPVAADVGEWRREIAPDDVLLFRYSALTFNGHRIHYDRRYVTQVEGYPGLIVHGPLIATLLIDLLLRNLPAAAIARFEFRAVRPVFDTQHFFVNGQRGADGKTVRLWASDADGWLAMEATATMS